MLLLKEINSEWYINLFQKSCSYYKKKEVVQWLWKFPSSGKESTKVAYESNGTGGAKKGLLPFHATADHTRIMFYSSYYNMRSDDLSSLCGPVLDNVLVVSVRSLSGRRVGG